MPGTMIALVVLGAAWVPVGYFAAVGFDAHLGFLHVSPVVAVAATKWLWRGAGLVAALSTVVLLYSLTRGKVTMKLFRRCGWFVLLEYVWLGAGLVFTTAISTAVS